MVDVPLDLNIIALEFFSGIGGLHYGLQWSLAHSGKANPYKVIASFDINHVTNEILSHNFGNEIINQTAINDLSIKQIESWNANCWLLSPPCQPFTRGGKGLDDQDPRSKGLLSLIDKLALLSNPPKYLFLENVFNFEGILVLITILTYY